MIDTEIEKLKTNRKEWVDSSVKNNFDFKDILVGPYSDPSHFIFEVLQNAEDAWATYVMFELFPERINIYHNGTDFDIKDVDGVTGIGISKKKGDITQIGKFGFGFKSVFAVTSTPFIFSGHYHFKIENFVIPIEVENKEEVKGTLISLPFNHEKRERIEIYKLIFNKLKDLDLKTLLFLRNIKEIHWKTSTEERILVREVKQIDGFPYSSRVVIKAKDAQEEYLVIGKKTGIPSLDEKGIRLEVAFRLGRTEDNKIKIVKEPNSKLVVFFPTEKVTFLNFLIQGPYKTTSNRENIPFDDEQNRSFLLETASLVADSLDVIKNLGYLDENFLSLLPIEPIGQKGEDSLIYAEVFKQINEKLKSSELLPTNNGRYSNPNDAILARGKELTELLTEADIEKLFSKKHWLSTEITRDKNSKLRDYLMTELGIKEVDFESFAGKLNLSFLQDKSDEWISDFYSSLLQQHSLWEYSKGTLRSKPIIRLEDNRHVNPFDGNGEIQVYLPTEMKSLYNTVKRTLIVKEEALRFLSELGLKKPDNITEVKKLILPKYQSKDRLKDENYLSDFEKILNAYETIPQNEKDDFLNSLSMSYFIDSVTNYTEDHVLLRPRDVYFKEEDLLRYFANNQSVFFLADNLIENFGAEKLKRFLSSIGVENKPRSVDATSLLTDDEKRDIRADTDYRGDYGDQDFTLEGLEYFLNDMNLEKSILLWNLLLKEIQGKTSREIESFFKGYWRYRAYRHRYEDVKRFDARFLKILKSTSWVYSKNNILTCPTDITVSELSDKYNKNDENVETFVKYLGFKSELIDQLPEGDRKRLELTRDIPLGILEQIIKSRVENAETEEECIWESKIEPDKVPPRSVAVDPERIDIKVGSVESRDVEKSEIEKDPRSREPKKINEATRKAMGRWGEEYALSVIKNDLKERGQTVETKDGFTITTDSEGVYEIIWLNKDREIGKGYDFVIKKNGKDIEYIEVKTKSEENVELIEVTGTQWGVARSLFDQNEGEKYSIYVVLNPGTENAGIRKFRNPVRLWREGKLEAHPVNLKF